MVKKEREKKIDEVNEKKKEEEEKGEREASRWR